MPPLDSAQRQEMIAQVGAEARRDQGHPSAPGGKVPEMGPSPQQVLSKHKLQLLLLSYHCFPTSRPRQSSPVLANAADTEYCKAVGVSQHELECQMYARLPKLKSRTEKGS